MTLVALMTHRLRNRGGQRHKEGDAAKYLLDALTSKSVVRDQRMAERMAERDAAAAKARRSSKAWYRQFSESVDTKIGNLSASVGGKLDNLEQRGKTFENKRTEKVVHPDDEEAAVTHAEFRIRVAVQKDIEERWKTRVENEDKITTNALETLRSEVAKMSAKMADEVVCMKHRHQGSAASTVFGSTGSGWQCG